jgi:hypothetical protein
MEPTTAKKALKVGEQSLRKRVTASTTDAIRRACDLGEADDLASQSMALITPPRPLKTSFGGEVIPTIDQGHPGLELALKEPDLLDVEVTIQRTQLADRAGVFEMAIEASESVRAKNSIQRMQAHQLALAHKYAMDLMADASKQRDPIIKVKLINCSARLMDAYSKGALALQRLQQGASQIVQVQHVQVNGQAVIGNVGGSQ